MNKIKSKKTKKVENLPTFLKKESLKNHKKKLQKIDS